MRLFPPPTPSITPIGVFVHVAQITNFVTNAGTWPIYDVTTEILTDEIITQGNTTSTQTATNTSTTPTTPTPTTPTPTTPTPTTTTPTPTTPTTTTATPTSQFDAILVGGMDYRSGDLNITQQEALFKKGFGLNTNVKAYRYTTLTKTIKEFLVQNPKTPIFLFSAGCSQTLDLSRDPNVDKNTLFVIEPFGVSAPTKNLIETAIAEGLSAENVYVGSYPGVGSNIKGNTSKNPAGIGGDLGAHWGSLEYVASLKSNLAQTRNTTPTPTTTTPTPTPTTTTPTPTPIPTTTTPTPIPTTTTPTPRPRIIIDDDFSGAPAGG